MDKLNNTELEGVLRRVQKLMAIAADDRANSAEASAAAAMAEKIMRKYQLEHVDIMRADFAKQENFDTLDVTAAMRKPRDGRNPTKVPHWAQWMAVAVAKLHDVKVSQAYTYNLGQCLRFAGYKADVQVAGWTFDYLITTTIRSVREYQKAAPRTKGESDSYRRGFTLEVTAALNAARAVKEAEQKASATGTELVVLKVNAVAAKFGAPSYVNRSGKANIDGDAFRQGKADGSRVDVGRRGIGGSTSPGTLRLAA